MIKHNVQEYRSVNQQIHLVEEFMLQCVQGSAACEYHLNSGGGRTRAKICLQAAKSLNLSHQDAITLASVVELLHNASLIHDDLQDNDALRREKEAVWKKFGTDIAICAGDLLITKAFGSLATLRSQSQIATVLRQVEEAVSTTIRGQCNDIQKHCATLAEYEQIAAAKSGPLLCLAVCLPLVVSDHKHAIATAYDSISKFAVAYQIADDLCDWESDRDGAHLNIVNVLAQEMSDEEAFAIALGRAQYLLKSCQLSLVTLPADCGQFIIEAAKQLYTKISQPAHD